MKFSYDLVVAYQSTLDRKERPSRKSSNTSGTTDDQIIFMQAHTAMDTNANAKYIHQCIPGRGYYTYMSPFS
jgi:hypothetical protein